MKWLDRLLGRSGSSMARERDSEEDDAALGRLRSSFREVRGRTDRIEKDYRSIIADYEAADRARTARKSK